MAKKDKAKKPEEPEAEKPAAAEGEEGAAPAKKKLAGKTLILFIILPAVLVLGGGGAAAMMLLGGGSGGETHESADGKHGEKKDEHAKKDDGHGENKDDHGGGATATATAEGEGEVGRMMPCHDGDPCYYVMPNLMVNLASTENTRPQFLKLDLVLESSDAAAFDDVPEAMPRLKDQLNSFLRELRVEDLNGSAGSFRLRRELMKRFNIVMAPAKIDAVLIEGMLIQ
jgi:flagellar FliL protein